MTTTLRTRTSWVVLISLLGLAVLAVSNAGAIPAFARKTGMSCNSCHSAYPLLNAFGRNYKTNGYQFAAAHSQAGKGEIQPSSRLILEESFPLGAVIKAHPFDKTRDDDAKMRAIHEIAIFAAGTASRDFSYFLEVEAEDEEEFEPEMGHMVLRYQPRAEFGIHIGTNASMFHSDPYNSLTMHRVTRAKKAPLLAGFASDEALSGQTQQIVVTGRVARRFFYIGAVGTGSDDPEGEGRLDYAGRLAMDVSSEVTLGGFAIYGNPTEQSGDNYLRAGGDWNLSLNGLEIFGLVEVARDHITPDSTVTNTAGYLQALYIMPFGRSEISFVPTARFEYVTANDGADKNTNLILNTGFYLSPNFRLHAEFFTQIERPDAGRLDNRMTLYAHIGF